METTTIEQRILAAARLAFGRRRFVVIRNGNYTWLEDRSTGRQWAVWLKTGTGIDFDLVR
jgi:hypothetical protein